MVVGEAFAALFGDLSTHKNNNTTTGPTPLTLVQIRLLFLSQVRIFHVVVCKQVSDEEAAVGRMNPSELH